MRKLVQGVGTNDAEYKVTWQDGNGKKVTCPVYNRWVAMLTRAYDKKYQAKYPTYVGATVSEEWLTFSNFRAWLIEQPQWETRQLDKDILVKGNKHYSPQTCLLLPQSINKLLNDSKASKGLYPTGVHYEKQKQKYRANITIDGKAKHLGLFTTANEAEISYLIAKSDYIAESAQPYRHTEPKLYQALIGHACDFFDDYLSA